MIKHSHAVTNFPVTLKVDQIVLVEAVLSPVLWGNLTAWNWSVFWLSHTFIVSAHVWNMSTFYSQCTPLGFISCTSVCFYLRREIKMESERLQCALLCWESLEVMATLSISWHSTHSSHYASVSCLANLEIISFSSFLPYTVVPLSLVMRKVGDNYFHFTGERTKSQRLSVTEKEPRTQAPRFSQELSAMIRIHSWPLGGDNLLRENIDIV